MKSLFLLLPFAFGLLCSCSSAEDELAEKGGHSILLEVEARVDEGGNALPVTAAEVEQAMGAAKGRLKAMGIAKIMMAGEGQGGILLKVPGVDAAKAARIGDILEKTSKLELHGVSPRNDEISADGKTLARRVLDGDEIVPGYHARIYRVKDAEGNESAQPILINRRAALNESDISFAGPSAQQPDAVDVALNGPGTDKMIAFTKNMRSGLDRIAIVLDGEVISAPVVMSAPLGKHFIITGLDAPGEAQSLAISLMHPLGMPLKVREVRPIPPAGR